MAMRKPTRKRVWITLLVAAPIIWWVVNYPTITGRYKLEVTVDVDGKEYVGSTVYEVEYNWHPKILPQAGAFRRRVHGEALFLDLGKGRNLVVTLTNTASGRGPFKRGCIPPGCATEDIWKGAGAIPAADIPNIALQIRRDRWWTWLNIRKARDKGKVEVPPSRLPTLVTFTDLNDPKSVKLVQPDELPAVYGPGASFKKVTLEVTSESLTEKIEENLPWLPKLRERRARLNGKTGAISSNEVSDRIGSGALKAR